MAVAKRRRTAPLFLNIFLLYNRKYHIIIAIQGTFLYRGVRAHKSQQAVSNPAKNSNIMVGGWRINRISPLFSVIIALNLQPLEFVLVVFVYLKQP